MLKEQEFYQYVQKYIRDLLPDEYNVARLDEVYKTNDVKMTGLVIEHENENVTPIIYLDSFYEKYQAGERLPEVLDEIVKIRTIDTVKETEKMQNITSDIYNYDVMKDKLSVAIVLPENNQMNMENIVHTRQGEFEAYYRLNLIENGSVKVKPDMLEMWGIDKEQLHQDAMHSPISQDVGLYALSDVVETLLTDEEPYMENLLGQDQKLKDMEMYVYRTNIDYGAAAILDADRLEQIGKRMGKDFYIIPSSVHEVILYPVYPEFSAEEITSIIREVNETQVRPEDQLSDEAYVYDRTEKAIVKAAIYEQQTDRAIDALLNGQKDTDKNHTIDKHTNREKSGYEL